MIFGKSYDPATTTSLRVPPASPTPGAPRDRPSASQGPRLDRGHRPDPDRDRPAKGAEEAASSPRVPDARRDRPSASQAPQRKPDRRPDPDRDRLAHGADVPVSSSRVPDAQRNARPVLGRLLPTNKIDGPIPTQIGLLTELTWLRVPPASPDARRGARPPLGRLLSLNQITGPIPTQIGLLTELTSLRAPPASPTPGALRDRTSTSQGARHQLDPRPDPDPDRPAHGADVPASSPRVRLAGRRVARPHLGGAGTSSTTRSLARSRPSWANSRS